MNDKVRNHIATTLKDLRHEAKLSTQELGELIGKAAPTIAAWERGRGQPDADRMKQLADIFGVPIGYFYGEDLKLTEDEKSLVEVWREATPEGRTAALAVMQTLKKDGET